MSEAKKYDGAKVRMELIPPEIIHAIGAVLTFGAQKYAARNWELGMHWSRSFGALMRHMWAWWWGEKTDPESGMSHLWHAACCLTFLVAYEARQKGTDDRPEAITDAEREWIKSRMGWLENEQIEREAQMVQDALRVPTEDERRMFLVDPTAVTYKSQTGGE